MEATFKSYNYGNKIKIVNLVLRIKSLKKIGNYMFEFIQTFSAVLLVMVLQHYILILFVMILIKKLVSKEIQVNFWQYMYVDNHFCKSYLYIAKEFSRFSELEINLDKSDPMWSGYKRHYEDHPQ